MKNLITIVSILAAGTLVANATTKITATTYLSFDAGVSSGANLTNTGSNTSTVISGAVNSGSVGYLNYGTVGDSQAIGSYSYHNNSNYLALTKTGISWTSDWTIAFSVLADSGSQTWKTLLGIGDGGTGLTSSTNYLTVESKGTASNGVGMWGSTSILSSSGAGTNGVANDAADTTAFNKVALVYDYNGTTKTGAISLYVDGVLVSSGTTGTITDEEITTILFGAGYSTGGNTKMTGYYDEFVIYDAALTAKQVSTYLSDGTKASPLTITIPEPSMFGLLAGTLALGLAGTRRRRRAK